MSPLRCILPATSFQMPPPGGFPYFRLINIRWFRSLKMEKFLGFTKFPFQVFDRYEIHIQAFGDSIYAFLHFSILIFTTLYKTYIHNKKTVPMPFRKVWFSKYSDSHIWKINTFKDVPIFSYIVWSILVINTGSTGPDLVDFLVDPNISQKVLQSIRNL